MWAIIGGTGFESFKEFQFIKELDLSTPFGKCSKGLQRVKVGGQEALFVPRHGSDHALLPHEINYRANIFALKKWGASKILSFSAVGSLQEELRPNDFVIPTQYIDWTKSLRLHTFCSHGIIGHVSLADPVTEELLACLLQLAPSFDFKMHFNKTYICIEGPQFSTRAESAMFRSLNADVIGMTHFPEYALAREAGLGYLPCTLVTDYDCWDAAIPHVTHAAVVASIKQNQEKSFQIAKQLLNQFPHIMPRGCPEKGLKEGLTTPWNLIKKDVQQWLRVIMELPSTY